MEEHDACICHFPVDGPALCTALHSVPTNAFLYLTPEPDRVESSAVY